MQELIPGWVHQPGQHCASTVLSDLSYFYGLNLSEPFCFGLGAGLGFFYLEGDFLSPTKTIMTRAYDLEGNFFRMLGQAFEWRKEPDQGRGWEVVKQWIGKGIPVLLHADLYYLDYYQSRTHFPLHVILLWGYDQEKDKAYIADTGWQGLLEIPLSALAQARYSKDSMVPLMGDYFPAIFPERIDHLEQRIKEAILLQANFLLEPRAEGFAGSGQGCYGMRLVGERIFQWVQAPDASWCFRWAYQIIERRGTGGSAFRKLYSLFLKEANQYFPELKEIADYEKMERISENWRTLAGILKELSEKKEVPERELKKASEGFKMLADQEQEFFERARERLKRG